MDTERRASSWFLLPLVTCALALGAGALVYGVAGWSLGLFFGPVAAAAILAPYLCLAEVRGRLLVCGGMTAGFAAIWFMAVFNGTITFSQWVGAVLVLASWTVATGATAGALEHIVRPVAAAAIVVMVAMLWLSWPVWLAPWLSGACGERIVSWLVPAHPLFALNGALRQTFPAPWAEHRLAYRLMNIGDDIAYAMPAGAWPAVLAQSLVGVLFVAGSRVRRKKLAADVAASLRNG